jgi:hypothetical protein
VPIEAFPFAELTPNELSFQERDEYYKQLHELPESTYRHNSRLQIVWRYEDVRQVLKAETDGITT